MFGYVLSFTKKIQILDFYQGDGETSTEIHKKKKNSIIEYILP